MKVADVDGWLQRFVVELVVVMMWTYFSSVLLKRDRPPLRVFHLERIKIRRSSRLHQLRLEEK